MAQESAVTKGKGSNPWGCPKQPHPQIRDVLETKVSSLPEVKELLCRVSESPRTWGWGN